MTVGGARPQHVLVEPGQKPQRRGRSRRGELIDVLGEGVGALALDVDLDELRLELGEPVSKLPLPEPPARQPVAERVDGRRAIRAEVGRDRSGRGVIRLGKAVPPGAGVLGSHVRHPVSATRAAAEIALPRERLQERSPAGAKPLAEVAEPASSADGRRELVSRERPVLERETNRLAEDGQLPGRQSEVALPARPLPRSPRCNEREEGARLFRREEMKRAPHRPGLDQAAVTQRAIGLPTSGRLTANADRELRGRRNLCLYPTEPAGDLGNREPPDRIEKVPPHSPRESLLPADPHRHRVSVFRQGTATLRAFPDDLATRRARARRYAGSVAKVEYLVYGDRKVFTVSAFNRGIGMHLGRLPAVWVEGEVTELRRNDAWANVFVTLKDPNTGATLSVTISRRTYDRLELGLEEGESVHVAGRAELYEQRGQLGLRATTIERIGLGGHLVALEQLKRRLAAEGLFASERKRRLPRVPRAIGILTGADAAARGDLVATIGARFPATKVLVCETRVQGKGAAQAIVAALGALTSHPEVDVVVLARGGGSFEDLLPFSDEAVVRAVAGSRVAVVSAVGHEQDTPLCDLAADARAATPTAAGALVVPDLAELEAMLASTRRRLELAVHAQLERSRSRLTRQGERLRAAPRLLLERRRAALDHAGARLQALSPLATLGRGYAIVRANAEAIRSAAAVQAGDRLDVQLAAGSLDATVDEVRP